MSKILVAMSGGVDSSVAAARLVEEGHEVAGVTLKLWGGAQDSGCCSVSDVDDARRVAQQLDIDHYVFNYGDAFTEFVVDPYVRAHSEGLTPNPCVECNRHIKFDALLERGLRLGYDAIATGHHARRVDTPAGVRLARGADPAKDQSYVLYMLSAAQLERLRFPVGSLTKDAVRDEATRLGLRTADKPDSQDVCFITSSDGRRRFLGERIDLHPGELIDEAGDIVGTVDAVELVTIGQRKGLDLGGNAARSYAVAVDTPRRRVTVGPASSLLAERVELVDHSWTVSPVVGAIAAQTSAHGSPCPATLTDRGELLWSEPQRRVAPGQMVVFYDGDVVVGGATAA